MKNSNLSKRDVFTSKSNVLKFLQKKIKKSKIEKIYDFTVSEWQQNETNILNAIYNNFSPQRIIVRSSAKGEDSYERSAAGDYESILNVSSNSIEKLKNSIDLVIKSYVKKGNIDPENQILIQKQTTNIITSGVVFTRTSNIGAPYYVINFEEGTSTERVTKGQTSNTIKIFRKIDHSKLPRKWDLLLDSIHEIESILGTDLLDIEFGITASHEIVIFQVRPITSVKDTITKNLENKIQKIISTNKNKFSRMVKPARIFGDQTVFSDMADWNPAEIIGNNPNLLDYSLYDYLIMSDIWQKGRSKIGYQNIDPSRLMIKFGNKPYVDIRVSFNSLITANIRCKLKKKLMQYYLTKITKNPHLHDKVEFEILFTCYELSLNSRLKELESNGFSKNEIYEIKHALLNFTNHLIKNFPQILHNCNQSIEKMSQNRINAIEKLNCSKKNYRDFLAAAEILLDNCKEFGTLPFSVMARIAFVGSALLKSLVKEGYCDSEFYNGFMNSISTSVSEIQEDYNAYLNKHMSKGIFLKKYGHLRPGTYDITSLRYDDDNPFFDNIKFLKSKRSKLKLAKNEFISSVLNKHGLHFDSMDFSSFVTNSIIQREKLKFEFTHNLSDAIEFIAKAGSELGFSRSEMANLDIKAILTSYKVYNKKMLKSIWHDKITNQSREKLVNNYLVLPPILFNDDDFEIIKYYIAKPNYITDKKITSDIIYLNEPTRKSILENKIIIIENADPGYDWIFTKNPAGLITKYGGVASHMAIRCAELELPAAIGCGEILFEKLIGSSKIILDCENEQIVILQHEKDDEYTEVQKTLKSLGYIK